MAKKKRTPKAKKSPEDSFAPIAKELALAYGRVNSAPARRLKWLLNFSGLDLDSLSKGRLADLRWELVVFGLNRKPDEMRSEFGIFFDVRSLVISGSVDLQRLDSIKTEDETKQFQDYLKAEMNKGHRWI